MPSRPRAPARLLPIACALVIGCGESSLTPPRAINAAVSGEERRYLVAGHKNALPDRGEVGAAGGTWMDEIPSIGVAVVSSSDPEFLAEIRSRPSVWLAGLDFEVTNPPPEPMTVEAGQGEAEVEPPLAFLQWNHWAMNVPAAHEAGHRGQGVRIAIIDGGIDLFHPEFEGQIDVAKSRSFVPGEGPWFEGSTHGTSVAGIIGARGVKILGVAPQATLVSVKVSSSSGQGWPISRSLQAIDYATAPEGGNARILNLSSIVQFDQTQVNVRDIFDSMGIANRIFVLARKRGAVAFLAAGNGVGNVGFDWREHPEIFFWFPPQAFVVGATGPCGLWFDGDPSNDDYTLITSYSNRGITDPAIRFIVAPGGQRRCIDPTLFCTAGNLRSSCNGLDMIASTHPTPLPPLPGVGSYTVFSGTSAAVPNASGLAAVILSAEPHLSPGQLADRLIETALDRGDLGFDPVYGYGHVRY